MTVRHLLKDGKDNRVEDGVPFKNRLFVNSTLIYAFLFDLSSVDFTIVINEGFRP